MTLSYHPTSGFTFNGKKIIWGEDRKTVRHKVNFNYKPDDRVIDLSEFNHGDTSKNIDVRRDIYGGGESHYYFFLNYTTSELLDSIEIHWGPPVQVGSISLSFDESIDTAIKKIDQLDSRREELGGGEILYPALKLVIASADVMGGDGDSLSYIYLAENVNHLFEDSI